MIKLIKRNYGKIPMKIAVKDKIFNLKTISFFEFKSLDYLENEFREAKNIKYNLKNENLNYIDFILKKSNYNLFSKYYIFNRLTNLMPFLIKKGNKNIIENVFLNLFINIKLNKWALVNKKKLLSKRLDLFFNVFKNLTIIIDFFDQTTRWKSKYILYIPSEKKRNYLATKWLLKDLPSVNKRSLFNNLSFVFKRTANKINSSYKKFYGHNKFVTNLALEKKFWYAYKINKNTSNSSLQKNYSNLLLKQKNIGYKKIINS